jgi:cytochrome c oxidase cbb3-type subunit IV
MDVNILREMVTVASFATFIGVVWFAVSPRNRKRFEEAARLPLEDEPGADPLPNPPPGGRGQTLDASSRSGGIDR